MEKFKIRCVKCGEMFEPLNIPNANLYLEEDYIDGAGQLCPTCMQKLNKDYDQRTFGKRSVENDY